MITRLRQPTFRLLALSSSSSPRCLLTTRPFLTFYFNHHPRDFTSTRHHSDNQVNHYEILKVRSDCTNAELKKQFYVLSKETHPDINPNDPTASQRFSQISESYSVLADPEKRSRYDRDFARTQHASSPRHRGGSYAGSRPASGLSKRRGTFRGPPPSFYAHGNPTARTARQAESSASSSSSSSPPPGGTANASAFNEFAPDFDPTPTFKTQTHEDARRQTRRAAAIAAAAAHAEDDGDFWVRFAVVTGVVLVGITVASMLGSMGAPKGGLVRGDGSRRTEGKNEWTKGM